tara:strand:- start:6053 stop:6268 length:216 start_codon:yes stop_codon:yes gene_type:complete
MKKLTVAFIALLMFAFSQASPIQVLQGVNNNISLTELDQRNQDSVIASEEMPRKRKSSRKSKRAGRRKVEK